MGFISYLGVTLEDKYQKKLDLIHERVESKSPVLDALLLVHGSEGSGKSETSFLTAGYFKLLSNRSIHAFFRLEPLIDFAKRTKKQIIIWDEPVLDGLSIDHFKEINKNLMRLLMTCRKKQHILIFNIAKFWKFSEYLVVDRATAFIHMYQRPHEHGRFFYIRRKNLEKLWNDFTRKRERNFKKYKSMYGRMPLLSDEAFAKLDITVNGMPHCTREMYDLEKDKAILGIGEKKDNKYLVALKSLQLRIASLRPTEKNPIVSRAQLAKLLLITPRSLERWLKHEVEDENELLEKPEKPTNDTALSIFGQDDEGNEGKNEEERLKK